MTELIDRSLDVSVDESGNVSWEIPSPGRRWNMPEATQIAMQRIDERPLLSSPQATPRSGRFLEGGCCYISFSAPDASEYARICDGTRLVNEDIRADKDIETILTKLRGSCESKPVVYLIKRLDYVLMSQGFPRLMLFIYALGDIITRSDHIAIICTRSELFTEQQTEFLKEELRELPCTPESQMEDRKSAILKLISDRNIFHRLINTKSIISETRISRMTGYRWLRELRAKGYIRIERKGRNNYHFLTERGRRFLRM